MYVFKTSGATYESVIRNQKHAYLSVPRDWKPGEIVLVSKNRKDLSPGEKQISYTMRLHNIRRAEVRELEIFWSGSFKRWRYIFDCTSAEQIPKPFNLSDVLGESAARIYDPVITFKKIEPRHEALIRPRLVVQSSNTPDEIISPQQYVEGACRSITVNAYERDPGARRACISYHGFSCQTCGFDFEEKYGELGKDFIHVHHIIPLADIREKYVVDPIKDMIPVCANCHSMIHRRKPALTVEELKECIRGEK